MTVKAATDRQWAGCQGVHPHGEDFDRIAMMQDGGRSADLAHRAGQLGAARLGNAVIVGEVDSAAGERREYDSWIVGVVAVAVDEAVICDDQRSNAGGS